MKFTKATLSLVATLSLLGISFTAEPLLSATKNIHKKECLNSATEISNNKSLDNYQKNPTAFNYEEAITLETKGSRIVARFSPQKALGEKIKLEKLASMMGYDHFNWVSYVEEDPHGIADKSGQLVSTPYNDPPQGGYYYEGADEFPFYWDIVNCDRCRFRHHYHNPKITKEFELVFEDSPADYRLKKGESIEFVTHLVGVKSFDHQTKKATWDVLKTFKWRLSNPTPGKGRVSLVKDSVKTNHLPQSILMQMQADGATIPRVSAVANCNITITGKRN